MSLDFLRKPELGEIVKQEYADSQSAKARDYIENYRGTELHRDFLSLPFTITPENREDYWQMYYATSPLSKEQTVNTLINTSIEEMGAMKDPLEKLMYLRDNSYRWSQEIVDYFTPELDRLTRYTAEDQMHKGILGYQQDLQNRLSTFISDKDAYLDAMVPRDQHVADMQEIERNNLGKMMSISEDGRLGVTTGDNTWIAASNISSSYNDYPEFKQIPKEEQFVIGEKSFGIIRSALTPLHERSRENIVQNRTYADNALYDSLKLGLVDKQEAPAVIANKISQNEISIEAIIEESVTSLNDNHYNTDLVSSLREAGKTIGKVMKLLNLRRDL